MGVILNFIVARVTVFSTAENQGNIREGHPSRKTSWQQKRVFLKQDFDFTTICGIFYKKVRK